jgi:hypothetical protein
MGAEAAAQFAEARSSGQSSTIGKRLKKPQARR